MDDAGSRDSSLDRRDKESHTHAEESRFQRLWTFVRYVIQGAALNLLGLAIFALLLFLAPAAPPLALSIATSFLLFPINYIINRIWVFRSTGQKRMEVQRFVLVYMSVILANALLFGTLSAAFSLPPLLVQAAVLVLIVIGSFLVNFVWAFSGNQRDRAR